MHRRDRCRLDHLSIIVETRKRWHRKFAIQSGKAVIVFCVQSWKGLGGSCLVEGYIWHVKYVSELRVAFPFVYTFGDTESAYKSHCTPYSIGPDTIPSVFY